MGSVRSWLVLVAGMGSIVLSGCGGGPKDLPDIAPVTGTVTLDDKPLEGAVVTFQPETTRQSSALTDAGGKYQLSFNQTLKGAAIGKHTVRISKRSDPSKGPNLDQLPEKYNRNTELKAEVQPGPNTIDFPLKSN